MSSKSAAASNQQENDELTDVRNAFYIGNFQNCINEAQKVKAPTEELEVEKDVLIYRSYMAQGLYVIVKDEITGVSPIELQAVRQLAEYLSAPPDKKEKARNLFIKEYDSYTPVSHIVAILAATIYIHEDDLETALSFVQEHDYPETISLTLQIYLRMARPDLAKKELKKLIDRDEDAVLSQLSQAWINMDEGDDKTREALYTFEELIDRYGGTSQLLNAQAACLICQEKYEEADKAIQDALLKDSNNQETLINLIVLSAHISRHEEVVNRYITQLRQNFPESRFVKEYLAKENEFNELCVNYEIPSIPSSSS